MKKGYRIGHVQCKTLQQPYPISNRFQAMVDKKICVKYKKLQNLWGFWKPYMQNKHISGESRRKFYKVTPSPSVYLDLKANYKRWNTDKMELSSETVTDNFPHMLLATAGQIYEKLVHFNNFRMSLL